MLGTTWLLAGGGVLQSAQALVMEAVVEGSAVRVAVAPKDGGNGNIIGRVLGALAGPFRCGARVGCEGCWVCEGCNLILSMPLTRSYAHMPIENSPERSGS